MPEQSRDIGAYTSRLYDLFNVVGVSVDRFPRAEIASMIGRMPTYRHRINGVGAGGELWVTTLHSTGAATLAAAHAAWDVLAAALFTGELAARYSTTQGMTGTVTDQLDAVSDKNVAQLSTGAVHMGTAVDTPMSPRSCLVIALKSATPTRHGRGRMFFPAPTVASITSTGQLSAAAQTAITADFAARFTTFKATVTPVIWRRAVGVPPKPYLTYVSGAGIVIISVSVGTTLGTQRRRTNKTVQTYSNTVF